MTCANGSPPLIGMSDGRLFKNRSTNNYTFQIRKIEKDSIYSDSKVSQANGFLVSKQLSPEKCIEAEIGRVPGQKWPHVIESSFNHHSPVEVWYIYIALHTLS